MAGILVFDVREGVTLRGILAALDALGETGRDRQPPGWLRLLAEELLHVSGIAGFDRIGIADCLAAISASEPEAVYVSPFPTGHRQLVQGALYGPGDGEAQPEAVALLTALSEGREPPPFRLDAFAKGKGDVRVLKGRIEGGGEKLVVIEANVDDMSGELLAPLPALLIEAGALDAWLTPALMKKGRPAQIVSALCTVEAANGVRRALFLNSSTLGVRSREVERQALGRRMDVVGTPWGRVAVKVALLDGEVLRGAPEFEECANLAKLGRVPLSTVYEAALAAWKGGEP